MSYNTLVLACYPGTMEPDKDKRRKRAREEFEVASSTRVGRPLQRKLLQRRLADLGERGTTAAASHGEESSPEQNYVSPREDRAG